MGTQELSNGTSTLLSTHKKNGRGKPQRRKIDNFWSNRWHRKLHLRIVTLDSFEIQKIKSATVCDHIASTWDSCIPPIYGVASWQWSNDNPQHRTCSATEERQLFRRRGRSWTPEPPNSFRQSHGKSILHPKLAVPEVRTSLTQTNHVVECNKSTKSRESLLHQRKTKKNLDSTLSHTEVWCTPLRIWPPLTIALLPCYN